MKLHLLPHMHWQSFISFEEIVNGRNANVRVSADNLILASDLVMVLTGKNCNDSNECLRDLCPLMFNKDKFIIRSRSRWISLRDAIELCLVLPGKTAKKYRKKFADIIARYLDGDITMCHEISKNQKMGKMKSYLQFAEKANSEIKNEDATRKCFEMPQVSYVYATKTSAFPGLIKIGKTINMEARLSNLNTACAPAPHVVVAVAPTFDNTRDERMAHAFFAQSRREGEFFDISEEDIKHYFAIHIIAQYNLEMMQNISTVQGSPLLLLDT